MEKEIKSRKPKKTASRSSGKEKTDSAATGEPSLCHGSGYSSCPQAVRYCVKGASGGMMVEEYGPSQLIASLKIGLPVAELAELRKLLEVPMEKLGPMLGISKATLHRRNIAGRLDTSESDRVIRFARLLGQAAQVMESLESGRQWLTAPQIGLGGAIPLEYAETEVGAREVEDLLGRIEYGVYS